MRRFTLKLFLLLNAFLPTSAFADELRPAYLSIHETKPDEFSVLWKVPAAGDKRLGLYLHLPDTCVPKAEPVRFGFAIRHDAGLHRQGMLSQAFALRPLAQ